MWTIILEEGFANDSVAVTVDGHEVFRRDAVRTSPLQGHAASFTTERLRTGSTVDVAIATRGLSAAFTVPDMPAGQLVVSLAGERIQFTVPQTPRGYG
jgi:hypothetical protein